jgi:hypothetical protein
VATTTLDLTERIEKFRSFDLRDRAFAEIGIDEIQKPLLFPEGLRVIAFTRKFL